MNEYLVQAVAREQLNDRIAAAEQGSRARRSTGRARRARRGGSGHAASGHGSTVVARTASPFSRAGLLIANDVRHPVGAFRSWLAAGQL
jgi:ribosomal protein L4